MAEKATMTKLGVGVRPCVDCEKMIHVTTSLRCPKCREAWVKRLAERERVKKALPYYLKEDTPKRARSFEP